MNSKIEGTEVVVMIDLCDGEEDTVHQFILASERQFYLREEGSEFAHTFVPAAEAVKMCKQVAELPGCSWWTTTVSVERMELATEELGDYIMGENVKYSPYFYPGEIPPFHEKTPAELEHDLLCMLAGVSPV